MLLKQPIVQDLCVLGELRLSLTLILMIGLMQIEIAYTYTQIQRLVLTHKSMHILYVGTMMTTITTVRDIDQKQSLQCTKSLPAGLKCSNNYLGVTYSQHFNTVR